MPRGKEGEWVIKEEPLVEVRRTADVNNPAILTLFDGLEEVSADLTREEVREILAAFMDTL